MVPSKLWFLMTHDETGHSELKRQEKVQIYEFNKKRNILYGNNMFWLKIKCVSTMV